MSPNNAATPSHVATGSEVYSSTTAASHEFFALTATVAAARLRGGDALQQGPDRVPALCGLR
jgi:hypothetical protein